MSSSSCLLPTTISISSINRIRSVLLNSTTPFVILNPALLSSRQRYVEDLEKHKQQLEPRLSKTKSRKAAVIIPICTVKGIPSILFTKRSAHMPTHASEISFPGGHINTHLNETEEEAAIREMQEECQGSYPYNDDKSIQILGKTQSIPAMNGTMVTPVVALLAFDLGPCIQDIFEHFDDVSSLHKKNNFSNKREVEYIFTRSIQELADSESAEKIRWSHSANLKTGKTEAIYHDYAPIFPGKEGKIWGLTAFILRPILKDILIPNLIPHFRKNKNLL